MHGEFEKHPEDKNRREREVFLAQQGIVNQAMGMSCKQCIRESQIDHRFTRLPLQNPKKRVKAPAAAMQIDLFPELPPSGDYENIVTIKDAFFRYLFSYPTSYQDAETNAKVIDQILTEHALLPMTIISDKDQPFCLT